MASRNKQLRELRGQLLPSKALEEVNEDCLEEEDDDCLAEEEDEPVFVDAEELCSGGLKAGSLPGCLPGEEAREPGGGVGANAALSRVRRPSAVRRLPWGRPSCFVYLAKIILIL